MVTEQTDTQVNDHVGTTSSVSGHWWYGAVAGVIFWLIVFAWAGSGSGTAGLFFGFLALIAWIGLPLATYFDMRYIRNQSTWNPSTEFWVVILTIWGINIVAGIVYLYRRHGVMDTP